MVLPQPCIQPSELCTSPLRWTLSFMAKESLYKLEQFKTINDITYSKINLCGDCDRCLSVDRKEEEKSKGNIKNSPGEMIKEGMSKLFYNTRNHVLILKIPCTMQHFIIMHGVKSPVVLEVESILVNDRVLASKSWYLKNIITIGILGIIILNPRACGSSEMLTEEAILVPCTRFKVWHSI